MKLRIKVDPEMCIGAASCVTVDPSTFELNADNKAYVLDHGRSPEAPTYERVVEVTEAEKANILLAAQSCPTQAVIVFDEQGNQLYPEV